MAWKNTWPPVRCDRFDGEDERSYRDRHARVAEIVTGFRHGRFTGNLADDMDQLLAELTDPAGPWARQIAA